MDADRIRRAHPHLEVRVENTSYGLQPCIVPSNYAFVDMDGGIGTALAEGTYVLVSLADHLDGPTDEDVEVAAKASRHTFQDRNGEWQNVVTQADLDEARRLLEAVWQARKERA